MSKRDYYEVLGIDKNANKNEIKMAFKQLARKYHPDVAENKEEAEVQFREINEAYAVLSDDDRKSSYDRFGHAGISGSMGNGTPFDFGSGGFGDIFDMFFDMGGFGGARGRQGQYSREVRGRDVRKDLEIELEDAFNGKEMTLDVETYQTCPVCYGRRVKPGSGYKQCQACQGAGMLRSVQNTVFGQFVSSTTCNKCQGAGQIPDELCLECDGLGKTKNKRKISVNIPRGIDNGQRIRITGEGEAGEFGGPAGDLYIFIYVKEHDFLKRSGRDLVADLPVGFADAALGSEKEIQSIDGPVKVEIKEGTQPGTVLTIKGKGMPDLRDGARGDMLVRVNVVTPTKLTRKQRDLLCQFAEEGPQFHCEKKGFLGKILDAITGKN